MGSGRSGGTWPQSGWLAVALSLLTVVFPLGVTVQPPPTVQTSEPVFTYTLVITDPASHVAHVQLDVEGLHQNTLTLRLRTPATLTFDTTVYCGEETITFPWHVANFTAIASEGEPIPVSSYVVGNERVREDVRSLTVAGFSNIRVEYDVIPMGIEPFILEQDRLSSYLGSRFGFFFAAHAYFLPPPEQPVGTLRFAFNLPEGWKVATTWERVGGLHIADPRQVLSPHWFWGPGIAVGPFEIEERSLGTTSVRAAVAESIPEPDRSRVREMIFDTFEYLRSVLGEYPSPYFLHVVLDEPYLCPDGRAEASPIMDLLRGEDTALVTYQAILSGAGDHPDRPWDWQVIPDEASYLWFEVGEVGTPEWFLGRAMPQLYVYAAYKAGGWDCDWRDPSYAFVEPKVWYYFQVLDMLLYDERPAYLVMALRQEIRSRTDDQYDLFDLLGYLSRSRPAHHDEWGLLQALYDLTGQDFTDWFEAYVFDEGALDPYFVDTDDDRVWDWIEKDVGLDPEDPDTDGDGLNDGVEMGLTYGEPSFTDPLAPPPTLVPPPTSTPSPIPTSVPTPTPLPALPSPTPTPSASGGAGKGLSLLGGVLILSITLGAVFLFLWLRGRK